MTAAQQQQDADEDGQRGQIGKEGVVHRAPAMKISMRLDAWREQSGELE